MRILNIRNLAPAMLFVVCIHSTLGDNDELIGQITKNPLQFDRNENQQRFPPPIADSAGSGFASGPTFSAITPPFQSSSLASFPRQYDGAISDVIAENCLQFGLNIALQLRELDPQATRSEIFSPLSVMSALSLLTLGARGKSYQELKQLIGLDRSAELASNPNKYHEEFAAMLDDAQHFSANNTSNSTIRRKQAKWRETTLKRPPPGAIVRKPGAVEHTISVANGVFVQNGYSLNPDYRQVVKSLYDSEINQLDYLRKPREARDYINSWVSRSTRGRIPQIITSEITKSTNVILGSVLYFKGFWETPFFARSTTEDNFYPDGIHGEPIRVQMMATGGVFPYYDAKEYDCRIIGLPYRGNETTMYIIQPNDSSRQKLRDLQSVLNAQKINEMIDNMALKTVVMVFPKMHFSRTMDMKKILKSLGLKDIFQQGYSDLSLIGGGQRVVPPVALASARPVEPILQSVFASALNENTKQRPLKLHFYDRYNEPALIFKSRFGENGEEEEPAENPPCETLAKPTSIPTDTDDEAEGYAHKITIRQVPSKYSEQDVQALANLEANRYNDNVHPSDLFVDDILHKVDFEVDENGTEAAAATLTYLNRSGTDVVFRGDTPFIVVVRHDPTKLTLFYGIINKPEL